MLAARILGAARTDHPPLVLLHGFTQNQHCWPQIIDRVAARYRLIVIDAPGHGGSALDTHDLWATADAVVHTVERLLGEEEPSVAGPGSRPAPTMARSAVYIGYSMGGRTALHLALAHPVAVSGLVLIGATPGLETEAERRDRRAGDERLAVRLDEADRAQRAGDEGPFAAFLDDWLALPLFAGLSDAAQCREARQHNRPAGLAASLRHCGTGRQDSLWDRLAEIAVPVELLVGSRDHKFIDIAERMAPRFGHPAQIRIESGSHAVHLENPQSLERAIDDLVSRLGADGTGSTR